MQSHTKKPPTKSPIKGAILLLDSHGSTSDSIDPVHRYVSVEDYITPRDGVDGDNVHKVNVDAVDLFTSDKHPNLHEAQTASALSSLQYKCRKDSGDLMYRLNDRMCARSKMVAPSKSVKWGTIINTIINIVVTILLFASSTYAHINGEAVNQRLVKRAPIPGGGLELIQHVAPAVSSLFSNTQLIGALHSNPVQVEGLYKPPVNPYSRLQESTQSISANFKPAMRKVNGKGEPKIMSRKKLNRLNRKKQNQKEYLAKGDLLSTSANSNDQKVPYTSNRREMKSSSGSGSGSGSSPTKKPKDEDKPPKDDSNNSPGKKDKDTPPPPTYYTPCYGCYDNPSQTTGPGYPGPWHGAKRVFNPTIGSDGQRAAKYGMLIGMAAVPISGGAILHYKNKHMHARGETWKGKYYDKVEAAKAKTQAIAEATKAKGQVLIEATKVKGQALVEVTKAKAQELAGNIRDRWRGSSQSTQSTIEMAHDEEAARPHHNGRYEPSIAGYSTNPHAHQPFHTQPSQYYDSISHVGGRNHLPLPLHREEATYNPHRSSDRYNEEEVNPDGSPPPGWSSSSKSGIYAASVPIPGIPHNINNDGNGLDYRLSSPYAGEILYGTQKETSSSGPSNGRNSRQHPPSFY